MKIYRKAFTDLIIYFTLFFLVKLIRDFVLVSDFFGSGIRYKLREYILYLFIILSVVYSYNKNKPNKSSIFYGLFVGFVFLLMFDKINYIILILTLFGVLILSIIYYSIIQNLSKGTETDFNEFSKIGFLENEIDESIFIINNEMELERNAYNIFKPKLVQKKLDDNGSIILNYSNEQELNFCVIIRDTKYVFIKHKKRLKNSQHVDKKVFEFLNNIC
ncbi:hypothetical protein [Tenacibaculum halocynthiae]|uniref:hypothetical protein n=1 Tax=Tenacibaculum halocynthiae TaxID=1254437 RepID=UPI003893B9DD